MKKDDNSVIQKRELLAALKAYEQRLLAKLKRPNYATNLDR
jgi:hypothetical protein